MYPTYTMNASEMKACIVEKAILEEIEHQYRYSLTRQKKRLMRPIYCAISQHLPWQIKPENPPPPYVCQYRPSKLQRHQKYIYMEDRPIVRALLLITLMFFITQVKSESNLQHAELIQNMKPGHKASLSAINVLLW